METSAPYGQAFAEVSPGIKVVKFMSAIERLTLTGEIEDITTCVTHRAGILIWGYWQENHLADLSKLYDLRSRLVHGEVSPSDREISGAAIKLSRLCRKVILAAVRLFDEVGIADEAVNYKALRKKYELLFANAQGNAAS